jgi:hypothetical protein
MTAPAISRPLTSSASTISSTQRQGPVTTDEVVGLLDGRPHAIVAFPVSPWSRHQPVPVGDRTRLRCSGDAGPGQQGQPGSSPRAVGSPRRAYPRPDQRFRLGVRARLHPLGGTDADLGAARCGRVRPSCEQPGADRFVARHCPRLRREARRERCVLLLPHRRLQGGDSFLYVRVGAESPSSSARAVASRRPPGTPERGRWSSSPVWSSQLTQPTVVHGFLLFALLAYFGAYLALRGFSIAFPDGDRRRYALLIMLTPTMLFWPSSISKDSWLVFGSGRRHLRRRQDLSPDARRLRAVPRRNRRDLPRAAAHGGAVRPGGRDRLLSPLPGRGCASRGHRLDRWDGDRELRCRLCAGDLRRVPSRRTRTSGHDARPGAGRCRTSDTSRGLGVREPTRADALDLGYALVTVPFRPFPHETSNLQALLASLEGLVLLGLFVLSLRRLRKLPQLLLRRPFVAFATAYSLGFIVAFANIGNFGILVRQRTQLLPLFFVLLCLPPVAKAVRKRKQPALATARRHAPRDLGAVTVMGAWSACGLCVALEGRASVCACVSEATITAHHRPFRQAGSCRAKL